MGVYDSPSRPSFPLFPLHPPPPTLTQVRSMRSSLFLHVAVRLLVPSPASFITIQSPHPLHPPDFRLLQELSAFDLPASPELDSSTNLHQTSDRLIEGYFYSTTNNNVNNIDHYQPSHWILSASSANLNNNYPVERWVFRTSITCNEHSRPWIFPIYLTLQHRLKRNPRNPSRATSRWLPQ